MHKLPMKAGSSGARQVRRDGQRSKAARAAHDRRTTSSSRSCVEAKEELFNLRFQAATGQLENHGRLRAVRKDIARIYTVMRERELGITTIEASEGAA